MEPQPRSNGRRVTLMMVLIASVTALGSATSLLGIEFDVGGHVFVANDALGVGLVVVIYGFLATRVSLPWYYVGWFLVPFIGVYALWKISWRVAYLPWRDWELRDGEVRGPYDVEHDLYRTRERMVHVRTD